jgi:hypothetical protein
MSSSKYLALLIPLLLVFGGVLLRAQDDSAVVKDFESRIKNYQSLKSDFGIPNTQTSSADKLAQEKHQASVKARAARPAAKQGDIFTPQIAEYFKRQIASTLSGAGGEKVRTSLQHAEPVPNLHLQVNTPYPKNLPLQSTPPTLLLNLPPLPKGLQYRIVGSTLFLYDENSRLVIDYITGAIA